MAADFKRVTEDKNPNCSLIRMSSNGDSERLFKDEERHVPISFYQID